MGGVNNKKLMLHYSTANLTKKERGIAQAILPLLEEKLEHSERVKKSAEEFQKIAKKITRFRLFETLRKMGWEPKDASKTALNRVVPDLIPKRTMEEAWELVTKNMGLVDAAITYSKLNDYLKWDSEYVRSIIIEQLFMTALYWDKEKGAFSTYFFSTMKKCRNHLREKASLIRLPMHVIGKLNRMDIEKHKEPNIRSSELAKRMNVKPEKLNDLTKLKKIRYAKVLNLSRLLYSETDESDDKISMRFNLIKENEPDLTNAIDQKNLKRIIERVLKTLEPREAKVLRMRYDLDDEGGKTLEKCGNEFGVTRERVRQIETCALKKLRHSAYSKILREFIL